MKNNKLIFRMAARCEAAGRPNNEDNYQLNSDLSDNKWGFTADESVSLGDKGALLVVCDGMGGMNAGEVASAIAVDTIKKWFVAEQLTDAVISNPLKYVKSAIVAADAAIKEHEKTNPETEGMGSTIVMAWLLNDKVYVGWCGDSRCYRYNPQLGLSRLSHDHSYVQDLVDAGKLSEELAFDHPNNNIITRSLGDPRGAAQPDVKEYDLYNEDVILLCSDGLCGCLRDNEIEEQIKSHQTSLQACRDALWETDKAAGWTDNVTIALAQIISGANAAPSVINNEVISNSKAELIRANQRMKFILGGIAILLLIGLGIYFVPKLRALLPVQDTEQLEGEDNPQPEDATTNPISQASADEPMGQNSDNRIVDSHTGELKAPATNQHQDQPNIDVVVVQQSQDPEVQIVNPDVSVETIRTDSDGVVLDKRDTI